MFKFGSTNLVKVVETTMSHSHWFIFRKRSWEFITWNFNRLCAGESRMSSCGSQSKFKLLYIQTCQATWIRNSWQTRTRKNNL